MQKEGIITSIDKNLLTISICREDACGSCGARHLCGASHGKIKNIECYAPDASSYSIGDRVTVGISELYSLKAVLILFIFPLVVLFAMLAALEFLTEYSDAIDALVAIVTVAVYYGAVYMFNDTIKRRFIFKIVKQQ